MSRTSIVAGWLWKTLKPEHLEYLGQRVALSTALYEIVRQWLQTSGRLLYSHGPSLQIQSEDGDARVATKYVETEVYLMAGWPLLLRATQPSKDAEVHASLLGRKELVERIVQSAFLARSRSGLWLLKVRWDELQVQKVESPQRELEDTSFTERLVADLRWFIGAKDEHALHGMPWRLNIMLHGPAGTGKTSGVMSAAHQLNLPVFMLDPATWHDRYSVEMLWTKLSTPSIVLIEDLDRMLVSAKEDVSRGQILGRLMALLDGATSPDGIVIILTTNHPEAFPPDTVRPGRIDIRIEVGALDEVSRRQIARRVFRGGDIDSLIRESEGQTLAQFKEHCRRQWHLFTSKIE